MNQPVLGQAPKISHATVRFSWLWPAAIVVLGAVLRLYRLDAWDLDTDEGFSANVAALAVRAIPTFVARWDFHPPLFYLILHFWRAMGAGSEFALRLLPVTFGVLSIVLLYRLSGYLLGRETGLVASFLLAISPYHIWFAQMLRPYAAVFFFTLLALDGLARLLRNGRAMHWVAYAVAMALALYTDYAAVLVWAAVNAAVGALALRGEAPRSSRWMLAQAAILLLYLPWIGLRFGSGAAAGWSPQTGGAGEAALSSVAFSLAAFTSAFLPPRQPLIKVAVVVMFASAWVLGLWMVRRRVAAAVLLASVTLIPIGAGILATYGVRGLLPAWIKAIPTRTLIVASAGYYPLLAAGFLGSAARRAGVLWLAGLVAVNAFSLDLMYFHTAKSEAWREIAGAIAAQIQPGEAVVFAPGYWHRAFDFYYHGPGAIAECYEDDPERVVACATRHRVFYVVSDKLADQATWRQVPGYGRSARREFGDVVVQRYERLRAHHAP